MERMKLDWEGILKLIRHYCPAVANQNSRTVTYGMDKQRFLVYDGPIKLLQRNRSTDN